MKNRFYSTLTMVAALVLGAATCMGEQHMRITGTESLLGPPAPGWTSFTAMDVISIPSLQIDDYTIIIDYAGPPMEFFDYGLYGGFKGRSLGIIKNTDGQVIGHLVGYYVGENLSPPPVVDYTGEIKAVGMFWAGPMEGLAIEMNVIMVGSIDVTTGAGDYLATFEGFLIAPVYIDFPALKASLKE
jgi:hypothetical protein